MLSPSASRCSSFEVKDDEEEEEEEKLR